MRKALRCVNVGLVELLAYPVAVQVTGGQVEIRAPRMIAAVPTEAQNVAQQSFGARPKERAHTGTERAEYRARHAAQRRTDAGGVAENRITRKPAKHPGAEIQPKLAKALPNAAVGVAPANIKRTVADSTACAEKVAYTRVDATQSAQCRRRSA